MILRAVWSLNHTPLYKYTVLCNTGTQIKTRHSQKQRRSVNMKEVKYDTFKPAGAAPGSGQLRFVIDVVTFSQQQRLFTSRNSHLKWIMSY